MKKNKKRRSSAFELSERFSRNWIKDAPTCQTKRSVYEGKQEKTLYSEPGKRADCYFCASSLRYQAMR